MPTQKNDISGNPFAIGYTAIGQTWTILKGVDVTGTSIGVFSDYANSTLDNSGSIFGGLGVLFEATGGASSFVVKNQKKGDISGEAAVFIQDFSGSALVKNKGDIGGTSVGVQIEDFTGAAKVANKGKIEGGVLGVQVEGSTNAKLVNKGEISGGLAAVVLTADNLGAKGPVVENHGSIEGLYYGMVIQGGSGIEAKVVNHKGGVLEGNQFALVSEDKLELQNKGKIDGNVFTSDYEDKIVNKGKIKGDLGLGAGDDVFKNAGKKAKAGMVDTGDGNDLVVFGKKADKLLFDSALSSLTNVDRVKKFDSGKDKFLLDETIFMEITPGTLSKAQFHKGTEAADADDRIIYDKKSGALYYDPDGTGILGQTQFARLDPGTKLKASDFSVGEYSLPFIT